MENTDKNRNEGFSGENLPKGYNPAEANKLRPETETDEDGNERTVKRARNADSTDEDRNWDENESLSRSAHSIEQNEKTIENKDRNSDIAHDRYPNSHPDNHTDRGNIKLDDE